jgi:hypothetical protein
LTDAEVAMIINSAIARGGTPHIYSADNLSTSDQQNALWRYPTLAPNDAYAAYAKFCNVRVAHTALMICQPAALSFVRKFYDLCAGLNPVHFAVDSGYAIGSGRNLIGLPVTRWQVAVNFLAYLTFLKGASWALSTSKGMALTPLGGPSAPGVVQFAGGGSVTMGGQGNFTPIELESAIDAAEGGAKVTLVPSANGGPNVINLGNGGALTLDSPTVGQPYQAGELEAAIAVARLGKQVYLRLNPNGPRTPAGATADLVVNGQTYDIYSPRTTNPDRIISETASKGNQAYGVVVNLQFTTVTSADLGNILARVQGTGSQLQSVIVVGGK